MKYLVIALIVFLVILCGSSSLDAYDAVTHRFLTQYAARFFEEKLGHKEFTGYYTYIDGLMRGAEKEDDKYPMFFGFATRSKNHFLNPKTNQGWDNSVEVGSDKIYVNAYQWAIGMPDYSWDMAIALYVNGNKDSAFEFLGHIIHLIQDATVSAHTHNDTHVAGDDYENYCAEITIDDYGLKIYIDWNKIQIPDTQTKYPLEKLEELFYDAAWQSYNFNRFEGRLEGGVWQGQISELFDISWDDATFSWYMKDVGYLGQDWWECEAEPGFYYLENTDKVIPRFWNGRAGYQPLCQYFAEDMLPQAVSHTVAVYKLFFETAEKMKRERGNEFYVSSAGHDDFGIGSQSMPYASLQRAIDQAKDNAKIHIGPGSYTSDEWVYIIRPCQIIGDATQKPVFIRAKDGSIFRVSEPGVVIENIRFVQSSGVKSTGIHVFEADNVLIRNCEFIGLNHGVDADDSSIRIEGCRFGDCAWGIAFTSNHDKYSKVVGNYFSGIGQEMLIMFGPDNRGEVTGNTFNVAYDYSNYLSVSPAAIKRVLINYHPKRLNARSNWWLTSCGLKPDDLVWGLGGVDVSGALTSVNEINYEQIESEKLGDINGDGQIKYDDFLLFQERFGSRCGFDNWNPRSDLDGDGRVYISDFIKFIRNYGAKSSEEAAKMATLLGIELATFGKDSPVSSLKNYPNPFSEWTKISFAMSEPDTLQLNIYNALGQRVRHLASGFWSEGSHEIVWDGEDDFGKLLPSGVYFYEISIDNAEETKKMTLLR